MYSNSIQNKFQFSAGINLNRHCINYKVVRVRAQGISIHRALLGRLVPLSFDNMDFSKFLRRKCTSAHMKIFLKQKNGRTFYQYFVLNLITFNVKRFLFSHETTLLCEQKHFIFYVIRHTIIEKCKHNVCRKTYSYYCIYIFSWNNDLQLGMLTYQVK